MTDMEKPFFTIGIASYNYAKFLPRALNAIATQEFTDYEVLISDDASTDNSVQVIKDYMLEHPEMTIRLIENKYNEGMLKNKSALIKNCQGKYLMICDADDCMCEKVALGKIYTAIQQSPVMPDRVISAFNHVDSNGKCLQTEFVPVNQTRWGWTVHHGCANRAELLQVNNIQLTRWPDDLNLTLEIFKNGKNLAIVNEPVYNCFVNLNSAGRKKRKYSYEEWDSECNSQLRYIGETIAFIKKRNDENSERDVEELRMVLLKFYYFMIFFRFQDMTWKEIKEYYRIYHDEVKNIDSDYLNNRYLFDLKKQLFRPYCMRAIRIGVIAEKCHIMIPLLLAYHIASKFKYFDQ